MLVYDEGTPRLGRTATVTLRGAPVCRPLVPRATAPVTLMKIHLPEPHQIGARVEGVDVLDLSASALDELKGLVYEHRLVVFRGQRLDEERYIEFGRRLGQIEPYFQDNYHHPEHPEIFVSSNVPMNGEKVGVAATGRMWHADYSMFDRPLSFTMVYPQILPRTRRGTNYIDMARVYDALPEDLKRRVEGVSAFHEATYYYKIQPKDIDRAIAELMDEFRQLSPGAIHPLVITHPVTRQKQLYLSRGFTTRLIGIGHEEGQELLAELCDFVERDEHVRRHGWEEGDILLWDNRVLIHHASPAGPGEASRSYRISLYDELPPYLEQRPGVEAPSRALRKTGS